MECSIRDISLHYLEEGSGRPLLILDGWGSNARMARDGFEPLFAGRTGWRRLYPDLPGHGSTPMPAWLRGPDDVLEVLHEFLATVAPGERGAVVGASWGAYLARGLLHRRTRQIDGVMFDIPSIALGKPDPDRPSRQVIRHDEAFDSALRPGEEWLPDFLVVQTSDVVEAVRAAFAHQMAQDPAVEARLSDKAFSFDPSADELFPGPALFVMGRQDHVVGYKRAWSILDSFPRATFAVLDRAGHLLDLEQRPLQFALANEWLDRVEEYATRPGD